MNKLSIIGTHYRTPGPDFRETARLSWDRPAKRQFTAAPRMLKLAATLLVLIAIKVFA